MAKYLFLDIDGVLNSEQSAYFHSYFLPDTSNTVIGNYKQKLKEEFCPIALMNLHRIVEETECKIVISSTWRLGCKLEEMKSWFVNFPLIQDAIIGSTKSIVVKDDTNVIHNTPRGLEIKIYLSENDIYLMPEWQGKKSRMYDTICILDDDNDMWPLQRFHIETEQEDGLNWFKANEAIEMLNELDNQATVEEHNKHQEILEANKPKIVSST